MQPHSKERIFKELPPRGKLSAYLTTARLLAQADKTSEKWPDEAAYMEKEHKASFALLDGILRRNDPKSIHVALAGMMIGWAAGSSAHEGASARYQSLIQRVNKEVPLRFVLREMQAAQQRFHEDPKERGHKFTFKSALGHWDRNCGFNITPQRFTQWRKEQRKIAEPGAATIKYRKL